MAQQEQEWLVPDMSCEGCVRAIQRALNELAGVQQVTVTLEGKRVRVLYDPAQVDDSAIVSRLRQAGFSPQLASPRQGE